MKEKPIRGIDFPQTHFRRGPSPHRAISDFIRTDQTKENIGDWCCDSWEGFDCPPKLKQQCFDLFMSHSNSTTVS